MATTYQTSNTGSNRKTVPLWSSGDSVLAVLPSGTTVNSTASGTSPLDTAGDFLVLFDVCDGAHLKLMHLELADMDTNGSPTFDADVVLRVTDGTTTTDVVLFNAGTSFQSAYDDFIHLYDQYVDADWATGKIGQVGLKVVAAAATGVAAGAISCALWYQ